jgi:hypothetical protein
MLSNLRQSVPWCGCDRYPRPDRRKPGAAHVIIPFIGISRLAFFDAFGVVHLDWEPPTEGTCLALPFAFDIDRQRVVQVQEFGEPVGRDVVFAGVREVEFDRYDRGWNARRSIADGRGQEFLLAERHGIGSNLAEGKLT